MHLQAVVDPSFNLVPWVVLIPVIGMLVNILVGKLLGEKASGIIASLAAIASFVVAVILAFGLGASPKGRRCLSCSGSILATSRQIGHFVWIACR